MEYHSDIVEAISTALTYQLLFCKFEDVASLYEYIIYYIL